MNQECSPGCLWEDVNNNFCDDNCFNSNCNYDGTDCIQCALNCNLYMIGNGNCDKPCNIKSCNYDDGDCEASDSWRVGILLAFGITLIVLSMICMLIFILIYCRSKYRTRPAIYSSGTNEETAPNITEAIINSRYPHTRYDSKSQFSQETCSVCLEDFTVGVLIRQLGCKHIFHKDCICDWLLEHHRDPRCPLCKMSPFEIGN